VFTGATPETIVVMRFGLKTQVHGLLSERLGLARTEQVASSEEINRISEVEAVERRDLWKSNDLPLNPV
jgi:hypothetical protein